jgi:hypothetical protein
LSDLFTENDLYEPVEVLQLPTIRANLEAPATFYTDENGTRAGENNDNDTEAISPFQLEPEPQAEVEAAAFIHTSTSPVTVKALQVYKQDEFDLLCHEQD